MHCPSLDEIAGKVDGNNFSVVVVEVDIRVISGIREMGVQCPALQRAASEIVVVT